MKDGAHSLDFGGSAFPAIAGAKDRCDRKPEVSALARLRRLQIRVLADALTWLGDHPRGRSWLVRLRSHSFLRSVLERLLGYRRTFGSFAEAQACAARYSHYGHEHPDEIAYHARLCGVVRESDYPVLFFLQENAHNLRTVFDLGGNVGNLFYTYQRCLRFSRDLVWMILDLPEQRRMGESIALERKEMSIRYADSLAEASGVDLFIASGSLHYFEPALHEVLSSLAVLPRQVVINRTPCSFGGDLITVQDAIRSVVPCKLHSRHKLVEGMQQLGYVLRGEWPVHERKLWVPLYPDCSRFSYSGFYFERT